MDDKIKQFLEEYIKNKKIKYDDIKDFSEELINRITIYCVENNIEILYDLSNEGTSFYKDIKVIRVLTKEEEIKLLTEAQQGNSNARNKMIEHNLRLVLANVNQLYHSQSVDREDLFQSGCLGLYRAIEKFDVKSGNKFSTYATWWIRQAIQRTIENESRTIRIPVARNNTFRKIQKFNEEFYMTNGYYPSKEIIKQCLGIEEHIIDEFRRHESAPLSLDLNITNEEGKNCATIGETIKDECHETEELAIENIEAIYLMDIIEEDKKIKEHHKAIFKSRYGLDGTGYKTLEEVSQIYGITRERVRQIEKKCINRCKTLLQSYGITDCEVTKPVQRTR